MDEGPIRGGVKIQRKHWGRRPRKRPLRFHTLRGPVPLVLDPTNLQPPPGVLLYGVGKAVHASINSYANKEIERLKHPTQKVAL